MSLIDWLTAGGRDAANKEVNVDSLVRCNLLEVLVEGAVEAGSVEVLLCELRYALLVEFPLEKLLDDYER